MTDKQENPVQSLPTALRGRTVSQMIRGSGQIAARRWAKATSEPDLSFWEGRVCGIATALAWIESAPTKPDHERIDTIAAELLEAEMETIQPKENEK